MVARFTTIGHSNRSLTKLITMLQEAGIDLLIDVRAFPRSRTKPEFNIDRLPGALEPFHIGYCHLPELGGRRSKQSGVDERLNAMWRNRSFHNYADYALGDAFNEALQKVLRFGIDHRVSLMCSQAVWWRCHRRIITDYLVLNGHPVDHLMSPGHIEHAVPTPGARRNGAGKVVYSENSLEVPGAPPPS